MAEDPGADALHDTVDHASFAGGVTPLKHHHHLGARGFYPFLHFDQLGLKLTQRFLVFFPLEFSPALPPVPFALSLFAIDKNLLFNTWIA
jgi:hypothetical protein